jgi:putative ABC transport system ATP-binding protein
VIPPVESASEQTATSHVLEAANVEKRVVGPSGDLRILSDVSLSVAPAEAFAIVGPSGSGKSTLLGILAGLDDASAGDVSLFGQSLGQLDEDARARLRAGRVGFVFQSFQLLPGFTALENVQVALDLGQRTHPRYDARALLTKLGLGERLHHYPEQLSGGEQQRVALARAFVVEPDLLFADEPTGNLDAENGARIIDLMFELRAEQGASLVLVTHDTALAARCDRQVRVYNGNVSPA